MDAPVTPDIELPEPLNAWFAGRGWRPHDHQLALLEAAHRGQSALLIAPTGGGKTLAGFLPSLCELMADDPGQLHTLYISPLKALAVDVARNLTTPISEMGLDISVETRTGDTPPAKRRRQRTSPPAMLLTTPEQLSLLLAYADADRFFARLRCVIIDELHALTGSKRGDLLSLAIARLGSLAPGLRRVGLSATVADPQALRAYLAPGEDVQLVTAGGGARPEIGILASQEHVPWSGHSARHALGEIYAAIGKARTALVFVNTRSQAEFVFQTLWRINDDNLPIALHHGSLDVGQRRKVEAAMTRGDLRAVVCTSTLDLGIDWDDVDLVIQIGAPKGLSRTVQRIGRANHRMDEPSRALLVPANRFEVLECQAARLAMGDGELAGPPPKHGGLDVLAQHILGMACAAPFSADTLYAEVRNAAPYADLERGDFDRVLDFVATGGYALRAYERYRRIRQTDGLWRVSHPRIARQYRLNVGTIVAAPMLKVRLKGGRNLGEIEEHFIEQLVAGDTFVFAGEILRFEALREMTAIVTRAASDEPMIPAYQGGKFPLSTFLAARVRRLLADRRAHADLPKQVADWLGLQAWRSVLPKEGDLLVETFPRNGKHYLVAYPFEGRLAHQTLGMLVTKRMERAGLRPLGFVASEYSLAVWSLRPVTNPDELFDEDMMGDDLDAWLAETAMLKRSFRAVAIIAGLIETRYPGQEKTRRQITVASDLIYDVLRSHQPDHILLRAAWDDAATGLLDIRRLGDMLRRVRGHIVHRDLERVSPLAVPILLDIGKESVYGLAADDLLDEAADTLIDDATRLI